MLSRHDFGPPVPGELGYTDRTPRTAPGFHPVQRQPVPAHRGERRGQDGHAGREDYRGTHAARHVLRATEANSARLAITT